MQFRKVNFNLTDNSAADFAFARDVTDPAVLRQATDTGVPTINYNLDGIGGIYNVQATNAIVEVVPSGWWAGTTGPLLVRATKQNQGQPAAFSFRVSDWNGSEKVCT